MKDHLGPRTEGVHYLETGILSAATLGRICRVHQDKLSDKLSRIPRGKGGEGITQRKGSDRGKGAGALLRRKETSGWRGEK